ncbi:tryptophan synthase subunit alpha [Aciduricibacillus chroicocephali]|uniref:Tryptophan synthase alpha chain n=1 Tax=Aciduricibacillus chroicocephali TaxID=3054939 RepID=A0ABY9KWF7_9BACI|nr:tryptophan synthase subunit alpha [Bacillaceae bacterium 44XB]
MSSKELEQALRNTLNRGTKLFIPYIMAGDGEGGVSNLENRIRFLAEAGASAVELGIPFSDPVADGPTIQEAGLRSLANGTKLQSVFDALQQFKEKSPIPIIFMTYINPIFKYGIDAFFEECATSGVSGIIIPDLPMEEEQLVHPACKRNSIALVRLAAMTSTKERISELAKRSEGFLYAVSVTGTTGARAEHASNIGDYLQELKEISTVPVLAGFGVSDADQAKHLGSFCDGVIVGSTIVRLFNEEKEDEIKQLIQNSVICETSV